MNIKENKSQLSWTLADYLRAGEEPPPCVLQGRTEGEIMEDEEIEVWVSDNMRFLKVFGDDYPHKFEEQLYCYLADLEYLCRLGKIDKKQKEALSKKENFKFDG